MRALCIATLCIFLAAPCLAQTADTDPATKDDVILYLRTMHSHDMVQRLMQVQSQAVQQLMHDRLANEKDPPPDSDARMKKLMSELYKDLPVDDLVQAMIPAYQQHFTHGDIVAMNDFYSSAVGQKVLEELPAVTQQGMQNMMPIMNKYLDQWKERMQQELKGVGKAPPKSQPDSPAQN